MARPPRKLSVPPKFSPTQAIRLLQQQIQRLEQEIIKLPNYHPDAAGWENTTINILHGAFGKPDGESHPNTNEFEFARSGNRAQIIAFGHVPNPNKLQNDYVLKQQRRAALLRGFIEQLGIEAAMSENATRSASKEQSGGHTTVVVGHGSMTATEAPTEQEKSALPKENRVFIGHGHSHLWLLLKDFLHDSLGLNWDEFNRESAAGLPTQTRLEEMLEQATFAFLVLTAEDEHPAGTFHPRENVIHEAGLFQGKLGFKRAIILREDGCTEFSNIVGLTQIPFPKGNIEAVFEKVRKVLEREHVTANGQSGHERGHL